MLALVKTFLEFMRAILSRDFQKWRHRPAGVAGAGSVQGKADLKRYERPFFGLPDTLSRCCDRNGAFCKSHWIQKLGGSVFPGGWHA